MLSVAVVHMVSEYARQDSRSIETADGFRHSCWSEA